MSVIEINKLQKCYGKHIAVQDVSFQVNQGEIFGFVGPNGAGKSTTIRILMGLLFANAGSASILGMDVVKDPIAIKKQIGYVPSETKLYRDMKVKELFHTNAEFYEGDCTSEAERLAALFDVNQEKRIFELSTGNKKKISIICALMSKPKVIILDEPTSGLDPVMQKVLFDELRQRTQNGAAVLLSSHNLAEVGEYCHRVAFIKEGTILAVHDLTKEKIERKVVNVVDGNELFDGSMHLVDQIGNKRKYVTELTGSALLEKLKEMNPTDFSVQNESLEERFWMLYRKGEVK